jgi:hypothetical protein
MARRRKISTWGQMTPPVVQPDAAGIDIGATESYVAVPADRDAESVRCFESFTPDLIALADWLQACRIRTVAMESTAVFWIPLFQILEDRGFQACLVNARHVKNVPAGRRTSWIASRYSISTRSACCTPHSGRSRPCARCERCFDTRTV